MVFRPFLLLILFDAEPVSAGYHQQQQLMFSTRPVTLASENGIPPKQIQRQTLLK
jgi:hypothetical protein